MTEGYVLEDELLKSIEYVNNGVEITFTGIVTSKELYDVNTEILAHLKSSPYRYQLVIFQHVEDFQINAKELREAARRDVEASKTHPGIKVAVVSDSPLVFGLGRMYEVFSEDGQWETMFFWDIEKAQEWINS